MTDVLYESLKEMYDSFFYDRQELKAKLDSNLSTICGIDNYLESIEEREEVDYKFFSPRSITNVYKEDIENKKIERKKLENENQYYYEKISVLDSRIQTISSLLNSIENSVVFDTEVKSDKKDIILSTNKSEIDKRLYVLDIQEKERQRIARDLHDTSLQNLAHLIHKIELSSKYMDQDIIRAKLELATVNKDLKTIIQEIRNTIFDLRPMSFDDLGLKESFERLIERLKETSNFDIEADIEEINCNNTLVLMTIYRIVEECINNAVKHSSGNKVFFSIKLIEKNFCILIKDNGISFNYEEVLSVKDRHFGLCILKERVELLSGKLNINSKPDIGTSIEIVIPQLD